MTTTTQPTKPEFIPLTYTPTSGPLAGIEFRGGHERVHPQHGRGAEFFLPDEAKRILKTKDSKAFLRVSSNPGLEAELDRYKKQEEARHAFDAAEEAAEKTGLRDGSIKIKPKYYNGDILSGYSVGGEEAKLLEPLGLAKHVAGWGYMVDQKVIDAIGKEFTYQQAQAYAQPAIDAKNAARQEKEAAYSARVDELTRIAKETGKPQQLDTRNEIDPRPNQESDITIVTRWVHPDGSITTTQSYAH